LRRILKTAPGEMMDAPLAETQPLAAFHHDLITRHLERDLRSFQVMAEFARGGAS
jgi:hypothetical protein